jgi:hypothetical protein
MLSPAATRLSTAEACCRSSRTPIDVIVLHDSTIMPVVEMCDEPVVSTGTAPITSRDLRARRQAVRDKLEEANCTNPEG